MLKITKVELELITDPNSYILFGKGTRGGVSYISNRCSKGTYNCLKSYDQKKESKRIVYLDRNNLYGYVISKFLATSGFKWIDLKEFDLSKYTQNSSKESVLEGDLEHPKELQELYNDYPLAPDKTEIKREMLSKYQLSRLLIFIRSLLTMLKN